MLFAIDIGNSHTVMGLFQAEQLVAQWRVKSDRDRTADELALRIHALFTMGGFSLNQVSGVSLASVVPTLQTAWMGYCEKYLVSNLQKPVLVVSARSVAPLIRIKTDFPEEVGADRLVNAVAAWNTHHCNLVIIDFGTAITFDCVASDCTYLGGVILPGVAISLDALSSRTAQLPRIDISEGPRKVIGTNTVEAMKSGILHGYGSLVDGMTARIRAEMGEADAPFKVIATGGMAHLIAPYATSIEETDAMLTLTGLRILHEQL